MREGERILKFKREESREIVGKLVNEILDEVVDEFEKLRSEKELDEERRKARDEVDLMKSGLHILEKRKRSGKQKYKLKETIKTEETLEWNEKPKLSEVLPLSSRKVRSELLESCKKIKNEKREVRQKEISPAILKITRRFEKNSEESIDEGKNDKLGKVAEMRNAFESMMGNSEVRRKVIDVKNTKKRIKKVVEKPKLKSRERKHTSAKRKHSFEE